MPISKMGGEGCCCDSSSGSCWMTETSWIFFVLFFCSSHIQQSAPLTNTGTILVLFFYFSPTSLESGAQQWGRKGRGAQQPSNIMTGNISRRITLNYEHNCILALRWGIKKWDWHENTFFFFFKGCAHHIITACRLTKMRLIRNRLRLENGKKKVILCKSSRPSLR